MFGWSTSHRPILIVLDPTPSKRLTELSQVFVNCGGEVYQGSAAWQHMAEQAGNIISVFIEKYIKPAIQNIEAVSIMNPHSLTLSWTNNKVVISNGENTYSIDRAGIDCL